MSARGSARHEHGHDPEHWSSSLYWFSQCVFQDKKPAKTAAQ